MGDFFEHKRWQHDVQRVLQSSEALMCVLEHALFTVRPCLHRAVLNGEFCEMHENAAHGLSCLESPTSASSEVHHFQRMKPVLVLFSRETGQAAARSALQHELQTEFLS
jgi:hypothetical protein